MGPGRSSSQWSEERERSKLVPINGHFRGIARALSAPVPQRAENMLVHIKLLNLKRKSLHSSLFIVRMLEVIEQVLVLKAGNFLQISVKRTESDKYLKKHNVLA